MVRTKQTASVYGIKNPYTSGKTGKVPGKSARKQLVPIGGVKKPFRFRPGTVALREIRKFQKTVIFLLFLIYSNLLLD